jgi:hypothetical protein
VLPARLAKKVCRPRRLTHHATASLLLTVEDAQGIALEAALAFGTELVKMTTDVSL